MTMSSKTKELQKQVRELRAQGLSYRKIGAMLGISGAYAHILDKPEMYQTEEKIARHREYRNKAREHNLEYAKEWRAKNPNYMKEWYKKHKDRYKEYNKKNK